MNRQMLKRFFAFILCMAQLVTCVPCVHAESLSATDGEVIHNHVDASDESIAGEAEIQPEADGESQPEADGEIQPEADGEIQPEADGEIQPEADGEIQPEADGEIQPEADGESQPEADGESQPEADGESQPEADGEDQSVFQPQESAESAGVMLTAVDSASCEHPNEEWWTDYMLIGSDNWQMEDARTHSGIAIHYSAKRCLDCDEDELNRIIIKTDVVQENHTFWRGICEQCGCANLCKHTNATAYTWYSYTNGLTPDEGGKTHSGIATHYSAKRCLDCGEHDFDLTITDVNKLMQEEHAFRNGVCDACEYVCTHEKTNSKKVDVLDEGEKWTDDGNQSTHSAKGKQNTEYVCAECSESWTEEAETSTLLTRKHSYKSGACVNCGAKKPSSDSSKKSDTSSNTFVTPILTPTPAPAEPEEMVAALTETVVQAEQEGASVTVDIVGAEEVFTPEHYEQVRKLPISEQILVTLASIGFEDVVAAAMQTMDVELSEEAAALMEQMNDTIEAMTDEERAEMQRKIEENFPKTEIVVDGVTYEAFVLELEINVDNKVRVERYSFRFDQTLGEWIFTKLDLVDAYVLREGTAQ